MRPENALPAQPKCFQQIHGHSANFTCMNRWSQWGAFLIWHAAGPAWSEAAEDGTEHPGAGRDATPIAMRPVPRCGKGPKKG